MTPQANAEIQVLRSKVLANSATPEDVRRAIELLREARGHAHVTSAASKAKKAPVDSNKLLDELDGL